MKKTPVYPSKKTLNLAIKEKSEFRLGRLLPRLAAVILLVVAFGKFAVMDRLAQVALEQATLTAAQQQVANLTKETADYDEVLQEYARYADGWMNDTERAQVDRLDALTLVEELLMPNATVLQMTVSQNIIAANLSGITLGDTSALVQKLSASEQVLDVDVFTASNEEQPAEQVVVSMVITLQQPAEGGENG